MIMVKSLPEIEDTNAVKGTLTFGKGKGYPVGTKRVWRGIPHVKTTEGWEPVRQHKPTDPNRIYTGGVKVEIGKSKIIVQGINAQAKQRLKAWRVETGLGTWNREDHTLTLPRQFKKKIMADFDPRRETKEAVTPIQGGWVDKAPHLPDQTIDKYFEGGEPTEERKRSVHDPIVKSTLETAKPVTSGKKPVGVLMIGGPASGKSGMVSNFESELLNFVNSDADAVKAAIPEYQEARDYKARNAAAMVHEESSYVVKRIRREAMEQNKNLIVDGTGGNLESYVKCIENLRAKGYHIRIMFADATRSHAGPRAEKRAERTGRYIPEDFLRQTYQKIPGNFLKLKDMVDEFHVFDCRGRPPKLTWSMEDQEEVLHDKAWHEQFIKNSKLPAEFHKAQEISAMDDDRKPDISANQVIRSMMRGLQDEEATLDKMQAKYEEDEGIIEVPYDLEADRIEVAKSRMVFGEPGPKELLWKSDLRKAMPYPEGTVRKWNSGTRLKQGGIWVAVKNGVKRGTEPKQDSISRKSAKGSPEMLDVMEAVSSGDIYMDDIKDTDKKLYNTLTKLGIISWEHSGHGEEYLAKLTESGSKELTRGRAAKRVSDRANEAQKEAGTKAESPSTDSGGSEGSTEGSNEGTVH